MVVVAFRDATVGGVSRSALSAGRVWRLLGKAVLFLPLVPPHSERRDRFATVGAIAERISDVDWEAVEIVHLHHGAMGRAMRADLTDLVRTVRAARSLPLPLMTKNVFAVDDRILDGWPGPRAVTTPGWWAAMQYTFNSGRPLGKNMPWIVANVQDAAWLRPPSSEERAAARADLGIDAGDFCIVRIGSPLRDKWSDAYLDLIRRVERQRAMRLILLGPPPPILAAARRSSPSVVALPTTGDDRAIRSVYWAADVFALDAHRGETFGNVLFEAMLCGVPAVYRARPFRDNTPWELIDLDGFEYARSKRAWLREAMDRSRPLATSRDRIIARYGYGSVPRAYREVQSALQHAQAGTVWSSESDWVDRLSWGDRVACALRHNPVVMRLKEARLR